MSKSNKPDTNESYMACCPACGDVVMIVALDFPGVADEVASAIAEGFLIDRVNDNYVRGGGWKFCKCKKAAAPQQTELFPAEVFNG